MTAPSKQLILSRKAGCSTVPRVPLNWRDLWDDRSRFGERIAGRSAVPHVPYGAHDLCGARGLPWLQRLAESIPISLREPLWEDMEHMVQWNGSAKPVPPSDPCQHIFSHIPVAQQRVPYRVYMLWSGPCGGISGAKTREARSFCGCVLLALEGLFPSRPTLTSCSSSMNVLVVLGVPQDISSYSRIPFDAFSGPLENRREYSRHFGTDWKHLLTMFPVILRSFKKQLSNPHYCRLATIRALQTLHKLWRAAPRVFLSVKSIAWRRS